VIEPKPVTVKKYPAFTALKPGNIIRFNFRMAAPAIDEVRTALVWEVKVRPNAHPERGDLVDVTYLPSGLPDSVDRHGWWVAGSNDSERMWGAVDIKVIGQATEAQMRPRTASFWSPAPANRGYDLCH